MKFNVFQRNKPGGSRSRLVVLLASAQPDPQTLTLLGGRADLSLREAFSTRGVLQQMPGVSLVVMDTVIELADTPQQLLSSSLEMSGVPTVYTEDFLAEPEEWLGRARLTSARQITYLPARQINFVNWSGGVGKTTLAMAVCKRFVERTGLPAALLELSMGGSALHARVSGDLPEFFAIATRKAEPAQWQGVNLYPMDGRTIDVLWSEDPDGVRRMIGEIKKKHTLFVVDCFPGHPLFAELSRPAAGVVNLVVTSPRDDALLQAKRLLGEIQGTTHLVLNMSKSMTDRAGMGAAAALPYRENWALAADYRLADPLLGLVYTGWNQRNK